MPTDRTPLGTGVPAVDRDHGPPIPARLVLQLAQQFPPAHIRNGFGQAVILQHALDGQRLDTDHLVLADESGRELVLEITPPVGDTRVEPGDLATGFLTILGPLL